MKKRYEITGVRFSLRYLEEMFKNIKFPVTLTEDSTDFERNPFVRFPNHKETDFDDFIYDGKAFLHFFNYTLITSDEEKKRKQKSRLHDIELIKDELIQLREKANQMKNTETIQLICRDINLKLLDIDTEIQEIKEENIKYQLRQIINKI